jgi:hypothetical protein
MVASSARLCDADCQREELSLPVRRQFEEDDGRPLGSTLA